MLIIGQPKACTTSLLKTLSHTMKIKYCNGIGAQEYNKEIEVFQTIRKYHSSKLTPTATELKSWILRKDLLLKDHVLPIKQNIEVVRNNGKVIILLREPTHSFDNYKRMYERYKSGKMDEKEELELTPYLFDEINWDSFLNDLIQFNNGWKEANLSNAKYIDFDELVLCPKRIILEIHNFLGIAVKNKITGLLKATGNRGYNTFTGVGIERVKEQAIKRIEN